MPVSIFRMTALRAVAGACAPARWPTATSFMKKEHFSGGARASRHFLRKGDRNQDDIGGAHADRFRKWKER